MGSTRSEILAVALATADRDGLEAVTVSGITAALGIKPPALYKHFAGVADLLNEMKKVALTDLRAALADSVIGISHDAAVKALAHAFRAFAEACPGRYALTVRADPGNPDVAALGLRVVDVVAKIIAAFGLDRADSVHMVRIFRASLHGFVSLEQSGGFGLPHAVGATFERLVAGLIAQLTTAAGANAGPKRRG